jgi:hypothetical protein
MQSSGMWNCVDILLTDVSEESIASIFRIYEIRKKYIPPKRRLTKYLHGATSQKTAFFTVIAVKTSNLKFFYLTEIFISNLSRLNNCMKEYLNAYIHTLEQ